MAQCYKDKERQCDLECAAYSEEKKHGTNCLALAAQWELARRMENFECASDIHSYFLKAVSESVDSLKETFAGLMK